MKHFVRSLLLSSLLTSQGVAMARYDAKVDSLHAIWNDTHFSDAMRLPRRLDLVVATGDDQDAPPDLPR